LTATNRRQLLLSFKQGVVTHWMTATIRCQQVAVHLSTIKPQLTHGNLFLMLK